MNINNIKDTGQYEFAENAELAQAAKKNFDLLSNTALWVAKMSYREKEIFILKIGKKLTHQQIADRLNIAKSTVSVYWHRARKKARHLSKK